MVKITPGSEGFLRIHFRIHGDKVALRVELQLTQKGITKETIYLRYLLGKKIMTGKTELV